MEAAARRLANMRFTSTNTPSAALVDADEAHRIFIKPYVCASLLYPNPMATLEDLRMFGTLCCVRGFRNVLYAIARREPQYRSAWLTLCSVTMQYHAMLEHAVGFYYLAFLDPLLSPTFWPEGAPELDFSKPPPPIVKSPPPAPPAPPTVKSPPPAAAAPPPPPPAEGPLSVNVEGRGRVPCSVKRGGPIVVHHPISGDAFTVTADKTQVVSVTFTLDGNEHTVYLQDEYVEVVGNRLVSTMFFDDRSCDFACNSAAGIKDTELEVFCDDGGVWDCIVL